MMKKDFATKLNEMLERHDFDGLIAVATDRMNDYEENGTPYEKGHENLLSEDQATYHEGYGDQLGEVVEVLTELNEMKQAIAAE